MNIEITKPEDVHSPRQNWTLIRVLDNGSKDRAALVLGLWEGKPVLAMRWNGTEAKPKGNPVSTGCPTWFIVPEKFAEAILRSGQTSPEDVNYSINFMGLKPIETLQGMMVIASPTHQYRIKRIERVYVLEGRDYLVFVEPVEVWETSTSKAPSQMDLSQVPSFSFRFHFSYGYEPDEVLGESTEARDGRLITGKLANCLHKDPHLLFSKNDEGHFQVNLP